MSLDLKAVKALADKLKVRYGEEVPTSQAAAYLRQCADEIDALRGQSLSDPEREEYFALKEDAERYRWLRDDVTDAPGQHHADIIYLKHLHGVGLDEAIDRARKGIP